MFEKEIRLPSLNEFCIKSLFKKEFTEFLPNTLEFNDTHLGITKVFTIHDLVHQVGKNPQYSSLNMDYLEAIFSKILNNWLDNNWVDCLNVMVKGKKATVYWCIYNNIDFEDPNTPYINRKIDQFLRNSGGHQNNFNKRKISDLLFDRKRRLSIETNTNYTKPIKFFNTITKPHKLIKPPPSNFNCIETYSILQVKQELLNLQKQLTKWKAFKQIKTMDKLNKMSKLQTKWEIYINKIIIEFYKIYRFKEIKFNRKQPLNFSLFLKKLEFNSKWFELEELEKEL